MTGAAFAAAVPANLGNGLDKVVQAKSKVPAYQNAAAQEQGNALFDLAITDAQGRVLVRVNPMGGVAGKPGVGVDALASQLAGVVPSFQVVAIDSTYHNIGVMDAWVSVDDVPGLAANSGVRSVILELKPQHRRSSAAPSTKAPWASVDYTSATPGDAFNKLGSTFDEGVIQHRVDQINRYYNPIAALDYEGEGMSIGFISNSYNAHAANPVSIDVANFDLPGDPGNPVNTQPVVVLQDDLSSTSSDDEGRGMTQIGYKMAPKARLAFATADFGEVGFADNIRALAGIPAFTLDASIQQGFAADAICDDVGYFDEPYFQDGIIGAGINDAAAYGVAYFSSAANDIGTNGYESDLRWTPNGTGMTAAGGNTALAGTNIDLTSVPPELYAGGFHNFNPVPNQLDVAQLVNVASRNSVPTVLEWDDPYDQNTAPNFVLPPLYTNSGTITSTQTTVTFNDIPALTAGALYELDANADPGSGVDVTVTITDPSSNIIVQQDNTVDEVVRFFAPVSGAGYTVTIGRFSTTTGPFHITLYATNGFSGQTISTDVNLLVFTTAGQYLPSSSLTSNNFATNEPIELNYTNPPSGQKQVQYVIARANVPSGQGATHVRYSLPGNGLSGYGPAEYFAYNTVTTGGHAMAEGSNGTAAYSVFRPSLPETFTSPGPVRIYFDDQGNRLPLPTVRRQPRIATADAANVSSNMNGYFAGDASSDYDSDGNFSGTSAAGPHAAAIAALVLEAHGGHHSLTPTQMTTLLEHSTFAHDLDPSYASGFARTSTGETITVTIASDGSGPSSAGSIGVTGTGGADANSITVKYTGSGNLNSITFNPQGDAADGGNVSGGSSGYQDSASQITYFENNSPGMVFAPVQLPLTVGSASTVLSASVTPTFSNFAPPPSNGTTQYWTMGLGFDASFTNGNALRFTVGRAVQHSSAVGTLNAPINGTTSTSYLGDLLGGGVTLPRGSINLNGMSFSGTTAAGTFTGVIRNRIGNGYSPVDGYGFVNAQEAVLQAAP